MCPIRMELSVLRLCRCPYHVFCNAFSVFSENYKPFVISCITADDTVNDASPVCETTLGTPLSTVGTLPFPYGWKLQSRVLLSYTVCNDGAHAVG